MAIKGCKSIAEYAFRQWMQNRFVPGSVELDVCGNTGTITDRNGDKLILIYDPVFKEVRAE